MLDLHATHQPDRHVAAPVEADLEAWLPDRLTEDSVTAPAAESLQGSLLGCALYQIEKRPVQPVRPAVKARTTQAGATAVATTWAPFTRLLPG